MNADPGSDFPMYRFQPYMDQSLRRAFELDVFEHVAPVGSPRYNAERIGWRNAACIDGFLAPAGIIPGENGRFIEDTSSSSFARSSSGRPRKSCAASSPTRPAS